MKCEKCGSENVQVQAVARNNPTVLGRFVDVATKTWSDATCVCQECGNIWTIIDKERNKKVIRRIIAVIIGFLGLFFTIGGLAVLTSVKNSIDYVFSLTLFFLSFGLYFLAHGLGWKNKKTRNVSYILFGLSLTMWCICKCI